MKYKKQVVMFSAVILIISLVLVAMITYINAYGGKKLPIKNGVLDITDWYDHDNTILSLSGDWEFYWSQLVTCQNIVNGAKPDLIHNEPVVWNRYQINGKNLPGFGYGTYRLRVTGVHQGEQIALWVPTFSTAYRLYINDTLTASSGTVSAIQEKAKPQYCPKQVVFTPKRDTFDIIIQVSNYTYSRGGMWYTLYLGTPQKITNIYESIFCRDLFFLGSFFVMAFIYCSIFLFRRQEKSSLYFAILCVIAACRTSLHGSYFINTAFPSLPFSAIIRMDYTIMYWFPVMLALLLRELFPEEIKRKVCLFFVFYAALMTFFTILTPVSIFTNIVYAAEIAIVLIAFYLFVRMCLAIWHDRVHAPLILVGSLIVFIVLSYPSGCPVILP
jgi:hypothetical protein